MDHQYTSSDLPIYCNQQKPLPSPPNHSQPTQQNANTSPSGTRHLFAANAPTQPYYIPIPSPNRSNSFPPHDYHANPLQPDSIPEQPSSYTLHSFSPIVASPLATTPLDQFQLSTSNSSVRKVQRSRSKRYQSVADPSLKLRSAFRKPPAALESVLGGRGQTYSSTQKPRVLKALTANIAATYKHCNPAYAYELARNPRRVLTKPSKGVKNDGYDNENNDFILYVNDILGDESGHQYLVLEILGAGTFGQVAKCLDTKTNELVGVKVVKNKQAYFQQSIMEVKILEWLNEKFDPEDKRHLLRLLSTFIHRRHLCLVFELLSVNLYDLIKQNQFRGLSTNLVRVFTSQILDALCVLKEAKIIHCDLKPENILLKSLESATIKVIDFGSACHEQETVYTYIQSRFYRSPEVLIGLPYTTSIDMWSLGCIAVELYLGLPLFPGSSEYNQLSRIVEMLGTPPAYMIEVGKNGFNYFERALDHNNQKTYHLKSMEQYSKQYNCQEQPSKRYFSATTLPELIRTYPLPKKAMLPQEIDKEMKSREMLLDFVQGLLNLNPLERWSPHQAKLHPFISGAKYTGHFVPPTMRVSQDSSGGLSSNSTISNILKSVPSPKNEADLPHPQNTYPPDAPEMISNQIRPKAQPHYQPSPSTKKQEDPPSLNRYQSQIPGLNLAPNHATSAQSATTPFFKSQRTGRSRANTVGGAHVSDAPVQLQRYAVMSSVNRGDPTDDPVIVVTVDSGDAADESRRKQSQAVDDELASISATMNAGQHRDSSNKSDQAEGSSIQHPSPSTGINSRPLPIRPTYTSIPKFQGAPPVLPAIQVSRPVDRLSLDALSGSEVRQPNKPKAQYSLESIVSPRDDARMSGYGMSKPRRLADMGSLSNSYEDKPSYLRSPMASSSFSYADSKPTTPLKIDTRFTHNPSHPRSTQTKFEPVSPYNENPAPTVTQSYFPPGSNLPRGPGTHNFSPVDIQSTQQLPPVNSNTSSGLGLYGVSQTDASEAQHSLNRVPSKPSSLSGFHSERSPQPLHGVHSRSETMPANSSRFSTPNNPNPPPYSVQQPPSNPGQHPRKNTANCPSPSNRGLADPSSECPRRIYQEYPLQEVTSEEPNTTVTPRSRLDIQDINHRDGPRVPPNTSQSSPHQRTPANYLVSPPQYETSPKQYQTRGYVQPVHTSSPLISSTNASYKGQSFVSPYQKSMNLHGSHGPPPMASSVSAHTPRQPPAQLQSIIVPTNEDSIETKASGFQSHTIPSTLSGTHSFDLDYRPIRNAGINTSQGSCEEEALPAPTSMSTQANTSQRKQWFDVKSYFGHGSRSKHKEKAVDILPVAFSPTTTATTTSSSNISVSNPTVTAIPQFPLEGSYSGYPNFETADFHLQSPYVNTYQFSPNLNSHNYQQQSPGISSRAGPSQNHYGPNFDGNPRSNPASHPVPIPVPVPVSTSLSYRETSAFYPPNSLGSDSGMLPGSPSTQRKSNGNSIGIMVDHLPQ
ncbi:hypothetical protein K493DRAFT_301943 [Basidiobolus meristosporus CBS 931.73]|uniref:Protein kinase domain-containing protein n=1 Tax=Basidiobolus meristosporus CBS 931.73 TaxID=1314790 RepID=A0A1Y1YAH9_9FUNG|nr:hypothetical protein K493DRAFT_301943 [Basidiobolus meristosporus CBS 931.73]|eukprot:ORX94614.1 hypothetical protein K493DRAFT_301943 [Basidiobolus meristosporus CBS 931.73]